MAKRRGSSFNASCNFSSEEQRMGTFLKAYEVDGERFELYAQQGEDEKRYQLVDGENLPVGASFSEIPEERTVTELVRVAREISESSAA
jgi:hypothetical protein